MQGSSLKKYKRDGVGEVLRPILASRLPTPCFSPKAFLRSLQISTRYISFLLFLNKRIHKTHKRVVYHAHHSVPCFFPLMCLEMVSQQSVKCFYNLLNNVESSAYGCAKHRQLVPVDGHSGSFQDFVVTRKVVMAGLALTPFCLHERVFDVEPLSVWICHFTLRP